MPYGWNYARIAIITNKIWTSSSRSNRTSNNELIQELSSTVKLILLPANLSGLLNGPVPLLVNSKILIMSKPNQALVRMLVLTFKNQILPYQTYLGVKKRDVFHKSFFMFIIVINTWFHESSMNYKPHISSSNSCYDLHFMSQFGFIKDLMLVN